MKIIEDLNKGILELISKKYKLNDYYKIESYKHNKIDVSKIKQNLTHHIENVDDIIQTYVNKNAYLCYYDIDIINLIIKYIKVNKNLDKKDDSYYTYFWEILGFKKEFKKDFIYYNNVVKTNGYLRDKFMEISTSIIGPYSY